MRISDKKLLLDNVTLCIADCANPHLASRAIEKSMQQCDFHSAFFFTHEDVPVNSKATIVKIQKMNDLKAYNHFVLKELATFISTDFVLLIQWDGYVLDANFWRPEFMEYDYIGARWHWHPEGKRVGNGGFSLRSKKLLSATGAETFEVLENIPEDVQIGITRNEFLVQEFQIRFAPEDIATQFSYERDLPSAPTFGFHGLFNMWRHCDDDEIQEIIGQLDRRNLDSREFFELLITFTRLRKFRPLLHAYRRVRKDRSRDELVAKLGLVMKDPSKTEAIINLCEQYAFWPHHAQPDSV